MAITNQSKPTTVLVNTARVNIGETWGTDLNTWAAETRTWGETASIIDNASRTSSSIANVAKP